MKANCAKVLKLADITPYRKNKHYSVYKKDNRNDKVNYLFLNDPFTIKFTKTLIAYYRNTKKAIAKVLLHNIH